MAVYQFFCQNCHDYFEAEYNMNSTKQPVHCYSVGLRVFTAPPFTEDRQRFFRNPVTGTKFSFTLGHEMPDSRRQYEKQLAAMGAEPVSRATMPTVWKENLEYAAYVKSGGERVTSFEKARHPATGPGKLTVLEQLKKSGVKIG